MDNDIIKALIEFFNNEFDNDPLGVADWIAQGDIEVEEFINRVKDLNNNLK